MPELKDFQVSRIRPAKKLYLHPSKTLKQFKEDLFKSLLPRYSITLKQSKCRLWAANEDWWSPSQFASFLAAKQISAASYCQEKNTELQDYNCGVLFPGKLLHREGDAVDLVLKDGSLLVIEVGGEEGKFVFKRIKAFVKVNCANCGEERVGVLRCKCGSVLVAARVDCVLLGGVSGKTWQRAL